MWRRQGIRLARFVRQYCENVTPGEVPEKSVPVLTGERGVNKAILIGRSGKDAEVRGTEDRPVVIISLATSRSYKKPDGEYNQLTQWHRVAVFRRGLADYLAATVKKGDRLYVTGAITYYQNTDPDTGAVSRFTSIVADDVINLTKRDYSEVPREKEEGFEDPV